MDGQLFEAGSTTEPLVDASVVMRVQILNPAKSCILYEEQNTFSTLATSGHFNIQVGSAVGNPKRTVLDSANNMTTVFFNRSTAITGKTSGGGGCAYTPATEDVRHFRFFVTPSTVGSTSQLSPDMLIDSVPQALVAQTLQGLGKDDVFQTSVTSTQAKLDNLLTTNYSNITDLIGGTSSMYLRNASTGTLLPTRPNDPSSPAAGQLWYDTTSNEIKYYNGTAVQSIGAAGAGISSLTAGSGLSGGTITTSGTIAIAAGGVTNAMLASGIDASKITAGTLPVGVVPTNTDTTKLPLAGGTMTGAITMGADTTFGGFDLLGTGHITMNSQKTITVGRYTGAQETTLISTLTGANAGATWYNSTTNKLMYWNGSAALELAETTSAGGDITAINTNAGSGLTGGAASGPITLAINVDNSTIEISTNTVQVKDAGIVSAKLATDSVTTAKIVDGNVTNVKIVSMNITKLTAGAGDYFAYMPAGTECATGEVLKWNAASDRWECGVDVGVSAHSALSGLTAGDDHTQYVMLAGRAGGQTIYGGTATGEDITIESTSHATKGDVIIQPTSGNVGIGTTAPSYPLHVAGNGLVTGSLRFGNGNAYINNPANALNFWTNGADRMYLNNTGNLHIGAGTSASNKLGVSGAVAVGSGYATSASAPTNGLLVEGNVGIGTTTSAVKLDVEGTVQIGDGGETCTIAANAGMVKYASGTLQYCNGSAWQTLGVSGSGLTTLNGQTGSTQTFAVSASGTAPAINSATDTHTLSIPLASGVGVTSGTISKTDYDSFVAKLSAVTGSTLNSARLWVGDASNQAAAVLMSGDATLSNTGAITIANDAVTTVKIIDGAVTNAKIATMNITKLTNGPGDYFAYMPAGTECNTGEVLKWNATSDRWLCDTDATGSSDHGALAGLGDDDHAQYALLAGRSGGQNLIGGTASGEDITIESTSHATKGDVIVQPTSGNMGIRTTSPTTALAVNGQVSVAGGNDSNPTYTFIGDTDTGFFSTSANVISVTNNAINSAQLGPNSWDIYRKLRVSNGSLSTPEYSFVNDVDSGMYTAGANMLGLVTGATERVRIDAVGNVGIGTTVPAGTLDVRGGTAAASIGGSDINIVAQNGGAGGAVGGNIILTPGAGSGGWPAGRVTIAQYSASPLLSINRGNTDSYVASSASATLPNSALSMGNSFFAAGNTSMQSFTLNNGSVEQGAYFGAVAAAGGANYSPLLVWGQRTGANAYDERMRIDSSGYVGIGTTTPGTILDAAGAITSRPHGTATGETGKVILRELAAGGTETATLRAPDAIAANYVLTLPGDDGISGQVLQTDGSGVLSWATVPTSGGTFLAGAGSMASPSISFTGDSDTGLYDMGSDGWFGITANGTDVAWINDLYTTWKNTFTVRFQYLWGTYTDSSSGLYSPHMTTINVENADPATGAAAGIGLQAINTATTPQRGYLGIVSNGAGYTPSVVIGTQTGATSYSERLRIDASGNMGIGTTVPAAKLDVEGSVLSGPKGTAAGDGGALLLEELAVNGTHATGFRAPDALAANAIYELPAAIPGANSVLQSNSSGVLTWVASSSFGGGAGDFLADGSVPMTGALQAAVGTVSAPGITFSGDTNTGIYHAAADVVAISTAGSERLRVDSAGNVGIGTTNPLFKFEVAENTSGWTGVFVQDHVAGKGVYIQTKSTGTEPALEIFSNTGSNPLLEVLSNGHVGIGSTTPRATLDVNGTIVSKPATNNGTATVDFSAGNIQYTTSNCAAYQFNNLKDGGSYSFVVQGTTVATCSFTAYTDAGVTSLTVHLPPDHGPTVTGKHTMYNLMVAGTHVYFAWTPGY